MNRRDFHKTAAAVGAVAAREARVEHGLGQFGQCMPRQPFPVAFFVGELEEDALAFGVFEPLAVFLEELVGAALALDPDEQRQTRPGEGPKSAQRHHVNRGEIDDVHPVKALPVPSQCQCPLVSCGRLEERG